MGSGYKGYFSTRGSKNRLEVKETIKKIKSDSEKIKSDSVFIIRNYKPKKIFWIEKDGGKCGLDFYNEFDENNDFKNISLTWLIHLVLQTKLLKKFNNKNDNSIKILLFKLRGYYYIIVINADGHIIDFYPVEKDNLVKLKKIIKYEISRNFKSS